MYDLKRIGLTALLQLVGATALTAQQTYDACYVPSVGAIYLINQTDLPTACLSDTHVAISWTEGGALADGSVTTVKLADGAVTSAKLASDVGETILGEGSVSTGHLADGAATEVKLGFDPATQAELDAHGSADDHGQYLLVDGPRAATDGFAVTGALLQGTIPATGEGVRLMWYPGKAAFRAGQVLSTQWDEPNIGVSSTALGSSTTASGNNSTALGHQTEAKGDHSTAMGSGTLANGPFSTAMGSGTVAFSTRSTAMGDRTTATGWYSTTMGFQTRAQAYASLVIGRFNEVAGTTGSWIDAEPLFVAGNGTDLTDPSNALTLYKDGNLTIAGTLTESSDIRLKEDIEPVESTLDGVLELTPIRYRFRAGTGHPSDRQIGLSAQQVERLFPELVARDSRGYLSVAYADLATVLVRAVQEQQAQIETLRAEVAALRAANDDS